MGLLQGIATLLQNNGLWNSFEATPYCFFWGGAVVLLHCQTHKEQWAVESL